MLDLAAGNGQPTQNGGNVDHRGSGEGHLSLQLRAVITSNKYENGFTKYCVELRAGPVKLSSVYRRFREFQKLHSNLCKTVHAFDVPDCPPKRFFGRNNPEFVGKRQAELQKFLDELMDRIAKNPPAESAWGLLCLFAALDPKDYVPEPILRLASETNEGTGSKSVAGGIANIASDDTSADNSFATSVQGRDSLAMPDSKATETAQETLLDAVEFARMEKIVEDFSRQMISVSRYSENHFQPLSDAQIASIPLNELLKCLDTHLFNKSLLEVVKEDDINDELGELEHSNSGQDTCGDLEAENTEKTRELIGVDGLVVSVDRLKAH